MSSDKLPSDERFGFWDFASEHKIFSGSVGTLILVAATITIAIVASRSGGDADPGSNATADSQRPTPQREVELDEDEDGLVDAVDECPYEAGEESSGCPDEDGDGLLDGEDRCPEEAATTSDGCPARPRLIGLVEYSENQGYSYENTENATLEQVTVAGLIDPRGIRMQVGGAYHSAAFTVPVNRGFQWIRGKVGITSEPCSPGSIAYAAVRDAEGQPLWPKSGNLAPVHRDAVSFKVRIASEDAVILYAEAPRAEAGYCGNYYDTTEVGWVHPELISE